MHHIIHKQSMNDIVNAVALHENNRFTVYHLVTILLHQVLDVNMPGIMPSQGGLFPRRT
jgi:hypothetical protein